MNEEKKSISVEAEDMDYNDINDYIKKEIEQLKGGSNVTNTQNSKPEINFAESHFEDLDDSSKDKTHNFFREFRSKLALEDSCMKNLKKNLNEESNAVINKIINFDQDETSSSMNHCDSKLNSICTPKPSLRTVGQKSPTTLSVQNVAKLIHHKKSSSAGSDRLKKKKKNLNKSNDIHSLNDDVYPKMLEKELSKSGNALTQEHLQLFKGKFPYLICTQAGSRCLQSAFSSTEVSILDCLTNDEVRTYVNYYRLAAKRTKRNPD